jgi:molybdopterin-guanine dinucleotide biosynthesis protein MobB
VKVVSVAGYSGSGKTTFIRELVPRLREYGPIGTIKHTGHHSMEVPKGKDTTLMFEAGSDAVVGIDSGKLLVTLRSTSLAEALDLLADRGVAIAVIEGFKQSPLPKIVIGDHDLENCLLRNPKVEDVIPLLDRFPDYITMGALVREIGPPAGKGMKPECMVTCAIPFEYQGGFPDRQAQPFLREIGIEMQNRPEIARIRLAIRNGALFGGSNELLIAIAAKNGKTGSAALRGAVARCSTDLAGIGIIVR